MADALTRPVSAASVEVLVRLVLHEVAWAQGLAALPLVEVVECQVLRVLVELVAVDLPGLSP